MSPSLPPVQESSSEGNLPTARGSGRLVLAAAALVVFAIGILLWSSLPRSGPAFAWLTPREYARVTSPGPLRALMYRVMNLTPTLWRGYLASRTKLDLSVRLCALARDAEPGFRLPLGSFTNAEGERGWLLSAAEMAALREGMKRNPGAMSITQAGISTADGIQCSIFTGSAGHGPGGLAVDVLPKVGSASIRLLLAATFTGKAGPLGSVSLETNLAAACVARFENGGGVVLGSALSNNPSGSNYLLLVTAMVVDSRGLPVKFPARGRR